MYPNYPQNAVTGLAQGQQISQGANQCVAPKQSVSVEIVNRLESLNSTLLSILDHQQGLIDRLHGASPATPVSEGKCGNSGGLLSTIDERLGWLVSNAQRILENQSRLDNLA